MGDTTVDVDDVSQCPLDIVCERCGSADDLSVCTLDLPVGVACMTLCARCVDAKRFPKIAGWSVACAMVLTHCEHLGIDLDEMAAARAAERGES